MSVGPTSPLRRILDGRREQIRFRFIMALLVGGCFGQLLGWFSIAAWIAAYAVLQAVELACFSGQRPVFRTLDRAGTAAALTVIALSSVVYGALAVVQLEKLAAWGDACAAFLLAGSMLNTVLTTLECKPAFYASALPFIAYLLILPFLALGLPDPPRVFVAMGLVLGGGLMTAASIKLWRQWTTLKETEASLITRELSERAANEERLFRLAHQDTLTGLSNRAVLQAHLADLAGTTAPTALLLMDLDGFKFVNDTLGHGAGDHVLREVASRLTASARANDLTVRLGGDEFALLLPGVSDPQIAVSLADRIIGVMSQPVMLDGQPVNIGASIGVAIHPADGPTAEKLFANADLALYQAKGDGRHCARHYTERLRTAASSKVLRDHEIANAVQQGAFELAYMPQISLLDGQLVGAEALLRWRHPVDGLLFPAAFLPALESGRLAAAMGDWVLTTACAQAAAWRQAGSENFRIGVNLFGAQFRSGDLVAKVTEALERAALPPDALELDITENVVHRHDDNAVGPLRILRRMGVGVAIDDFGAGHASLTMLKRYPLSRMKIDRVFSQSVGNSQADVVLVRSIVSMASAFNLSVTAEGVENQRQADLMRRCGCEEAHGFFYGQAVTAAEFARAHLAVPAAASV
jgi:diguanylate cyclase (GGDEF)-like protein